MYPEAVRPRSPPRSNVAMSISRTELAACVTHSVNWEPVDLFKLRKKLLRYFSNRAKHHPCSVNTYSCCPSRIVSVRFPFFSPTQTSTPSSFESTVMTEFPPSSFLREATCSSILQSQTPFAHPHSSH